MNSILKSPVDSVIKNQINSDHQTKTNRSSVSIIKSCSSWSGYGLDKQVIKNLDTITSFVPEELHKRIIQSILQAHHLEILVPSSTNTTKALQAAILSFLAQKLKQDQYPPPTTQTVSPIVLVLATNPKAVERHGKVCRRLGTDINGLQLDLIQHHHSLNTDLDLARASLNRPIWITTLTRANLLLQHQALSLNNLSILVLDLRHSNQLNHHLTAELEPLINSLSSHVQLIILISLNARLSPTLSGLISQKIESSIRINLTHHPSTPSLSPPSLSSSTSYSLSQLTSPPSATLTTSKPVMINIDHGYQPNDQAQNIVTTFNNIQLKTKYAPPI